MADVEREKATSNNLKKMLAATVIASTLACSAMLGMTVAANELSKESHITGSFMKTLNGDTVKTEQATYSVEDIRDLVELDTDVLFSLDQVSVPLAAGCRPYSNSHHPHFF